MFLSDNGGDRQAPETLNGVVAVGFNKGASQIISPG